jgi:prefoldin subunit 5
VSRALYVDWPCSQGTAASTAERRETAVARVEHKQDELSEIEQEILDEIERIDAEWQEKAAEVETVAIRAEAADVRVEELKLLWVPT